MRIILTDFVAAKSDLLILYKQSENGPLRKHLNLVWKNKKHIHKDTREPSAFTEQFNLLNQQQLDKH